MEIFQEEVVDGSEGLRWLGQQAGPVFGIHKQKGLYKNKLKNNRKRRFHPKIPGKNKTFGKRNIEGNASSDVAHRTAPNVH